MGIPASAVHRLLNLLAGEGMVERNDAMRMYRPGIEFFRMASSICNRIPMHGLALPFLREAVADNNENAYLGMLDLQAGKMLFAAVAESNNVPELQVQGFDYRTAGYVRREVASGISTEKVARLVLNLATNSSETTHSIRL